MRGPHPGCPLTPLSPQRSDPQLLAQFYHADEELSQVAAELDSLDGRKDPQRCTLLVSQFRSCQVRGGAGGGAAGSPAGGGGGGQSW